MKLNFRNTDRGVPLGSLKPGECFSHNSIVNDACMVCSSAEETNREDDETVTVNLYNGEICYEDSSMTVYCVTVEGFVK